MKLFNFMQYIYCNILAHPAKLIYLIFNHLRCVSLVATESQVVENLFIDLTPNIHISYFDVYWTNKTD